MASRIQKITLLPSFVMFLLSILFAVGSFIIMDFSLKQGLLILTSSLFVGGLSYSAYWGYSWIWSKKIHQYENSRLVKLFSNSLLIGTIFLSLGLVILVWIFQLVWNDLVFWGKDLGLIFFGSRVDEFIGLKIGMRVIHYFFLGLTFMLVGLISIMHRLRSCPKYFGYLGSIYRKEMVMPVKCFDCTLKKDCIMTDNRSQGF
jgi:hypothetical protein